MNIDKTIYELQDKLTGFEITKLGKGTSEKISIGLPQEKSDLRVTLLNKITETTGASFVSDKRSVDGVCIEANKENLGKLNTALSAGKLDDLSIEKLEEVATAEERKISSHIRHASPGLTEHIFRLAVKEEFRATEKS